MAKRTAGRETVAAKLGDAELVLLASGGRSPERLVTAPTTLKVVTLQRAAANLLKRGLAEERPAGVGQTPWREDGEERTVLMVTAAGLAAIGKEEDAPEADPAPDAGLKVNAPINAPDPVAPRPGSKGALLVEMLSRVSGASIDELVAAMGWLPHTTRAALTGLRKRGFAVDREAGSEGSRYRIAQPEPAKPVRPPRRKIADVQAAA